MMMKHLNHGNILRLVDIVNPLPYDQFNDVYLVTEFMDTDLEEVINSSQELSPDHIQFFKYQIVCATKVMYTPAYTLNCNSAINLSTSTQLTSSTETSSLAIYSSQSIARSKY